MADPFDVPRSSGSAGLRAGTYLSNHRRLARACKQRAGNRCERCGRPNRTLGFNQRGEVTMLYLHGAHQFHDRCNPEAAYLCLCPACHRAWDEEHRKAVRQLDRKLRAAIARPGTVITSEEEQALLKQHAGLLAQEQADAQTWREAQALAAPERQVCEARALWARCKRLRLELHLARLVVAHLRAGPSLSPRLARDLQDWYRGKRDSYQLALEAYQRLMAPQATAAATEAAPMTPWGTAQVSPGRAPVLARTRRQFQRKDESDVARER